VNTPPSSVVAGLVAALRPRQWTKNLLVVAAPLGAGILGSREGIEAVLVSFVAFCLASGATYVLNDLRDLERDRAHPRKQNRPFASGVVPVPLGAALGVAALAGAIGVALLRDDLVWVVLGYVAITTSYSLWLKHLAVVELIAVAAGFVIRAVAGAVAASVPVSPWFFVVVSAGALLMVTGKRSAEVHHLGDGATSARPVLAEYTAGYLRSVENIAASLALVGYALWSFDSAIATRGGIAAVAFKVSLAPFAAALLRFVLVVDRGESAEPEYVLVRDRQMLVLSLVWMGVYGAGVLAS
jgi:decaprenyl-phosphate phosphoribosyltransferase